MSKDAILHKLWTIAANHKDTYNKEDWKKLETLVWVGIKAREEFDACNSLLDYVAEKSSRLMAERNAARRELCNNDYNVDVLKSELSDNAKVHGYKSPAEVAKKRGYPKLFDAKPIHITHSKLERADDESAYRSRCPGCKDGLLLVMRDQKTMQLQAEDRCVSCGQLFIYDDIEEMRAAES